MENEDLLNDETTSAAGAGFTTQAALGGTTIDVETIELAPVLEDEIFEDEGDVAPIEEPLRPEFDALPEDEFLGSDPIEFAEFENQLFAIDPLAFATTVVEADGDAVEPVAFDAPAPSQDEQLEAIANVDGTGEDEQAPVTDIEEGDGPVQTDAAAPDDMDQDAEELPTDIGDVASQTGAVDAEDGADDAVEDDGAADLDMAECPETMAATTETVTDEDDPVAETDGDDELVIVTDETDGGDDELVDLAFEEPVIDEASATDTFDAVDELALFADAEGVDDANGDDDIYSEDADVEADEAAGSLMDLDCLDMLPAECLAEMLDLLADMATEPEAAAADDMGECQ